MRIAESKHLPVNKTRATKNGASAAEPIATCWKCAPSVNKGAPTASLKSELPQRQAKRQAADRWIHFWTRSTHRPMGFVSYLQHSCRSSQPVHGAKARYVFALAVASKCSGQPQ